MVKLTKYEVAIMNEAFIIGRIYQSMGEKESPVEIQDKLLLRCKGVKEQVKREGGRLL